MIFKEIVESNRQFILITIAGMIAVLLFFGGGYLACSNGQGRMVAFSCLEIKEIGVCNIGEQQYIMTDYYKELYEDGNLSNEWYIYENDSYIVVE